MLPDLANQAGDVCPGFGRIDRCSPIVSGRAPVRNDRLQAGLLTIVEPAWSDKASEGKTAFLNLLQHRQIIRRTVPRHNRENIRVGGANFELTTEERGGQKPPFQSANHKLHLRNTDTEAAPTNKCIVL